MDINIEQECLEVEEKLSAYLDNTTVDMDESSKREYLDSMKSYFDSFLETMRRYPPRTIQEAKEEWDNLFYHLQIYDGRLSI